KEARGLRKIDRGARDEAGDAAVGESGNGVGLHDDHGSASQEGGDDGRSSDVAPHAKYGRGFARELHAALGDDGESGESGELLGEADAVETADFDGAEFEAFGGNEAAFHAFFRADEEDV